MLKVFVYGTLKPKEANYEAFCGGKVVEATRAYTNGILYDLPNHGYPAMTKGTAKVEGFLLTFVDEEVLIGLDRLEGYDERRSPHENEYERRRVPIYDLDGNFLAEAWTYFMSLDKIKGKKGIRVSSGYWIGKT